MQNIIKTLKEMPEHKLFGLAIITTILLTLAGNGLFLLELKFLYPICYLFRLVASVLAVVTICEIVCRKFFHIRHRAIAQPTKIVLGFMVAAYSAVFFDILTNVKSPDVFVPFISHVFGWAFLIVSISFFGVYAIRFLLMVNRALEKKCQE